MTLPLKINLLVFAATQFKQIPSSWHGNAFCDQNDNKVGNLNVKFLYYFSFPQQGWGEGVLQVELNQTPNLLSCLQTCFSVDKINKYINFILWGLHLTVLWLTNQRPSEFPIKVEFRSVGFCGGRKTGKNPQSKERTNNKLDPHMMPGPRIEPGPHWWEASALTTAPSQLP